MINTRLSHSFVMLPTSNEGDVMGDVLKINKLLRAHGTLA